MVDNKIIGKSITSITTIVSIVSIVSIISIVGIGILFGSNYDIFSSSYKSNDIVDIKIKNKDKYILITNSDDEYRQMYNIIEKASGLDKDPYGRKISPRVVKKFCHIARNKSIDLNNITEEEFDIIYRTYSEYLIEKYEKKN